MIKNISGIRFGKLVAVEYCGSTNLGQALWKCLCDCGKECVVRGSYLRNKHTLSCGCLQKEKSSIACVKSGRDKTVKHDMAKTPEYRAWSHMKDRCNNPKDKNYKNYGARGIKVCDEWINSFDKFLEHIGRKPERKLSIDRIDNNGNYEPGNVRWATSKQQAMNTRRSRKYLEIEVADNG